MPHAHPGAGAGVILIIRCTCGHSLDRHMDTEACEVDGCRCVGFEFGWNEEAEETVRA